MNFMSSSSTCIKLVNHIHQAGDLDTFLSFSLVVWIRHRLRRHGGFVFRVLASNHGYLEGFGWVMNRKKQIPFIQKHALSITRTLNESTKMFVQISHGRIFACRSFTVLASFSLFLDSCKPNWRKDAAITKLVGVFSHRESQMAEAVCGGT